MALLERLPYLVIAILMAGAFSVGVASAEPIKITLYDDGMACPGDCDAHVVFHRSLNGTEFAHSPVTGKDSFEACTRGELCQICFEQGRRQCMLARYRGSGPGPMTFDFTPAFFREKCAADGIPQRLRAHCETMRQTARSWHSRINCIKNPQRAECKGVIDAANERQKMDRPEYLSCRQQGSRRYNSERPANSQRTADCAYEVESRGRNSRGLTWKLLLPGACRDGTYVGRDGLDCCSGDPLIDAQFGRECLMFYPVEQRR